jgi:cell division transport system permease protein
VADRLTSFDFVEDVRFGRDWIERLDRLRNVAGIVVLMIGLAFAGVAIVIIGTTIRMTVLQRAGEIGIMRLVGAGDWFIRGPFLLEGALKGFLGGLLSVILCWLAFVLFQRQGVGGLTGLVFFTAPQLALLVLFGVVIGLGGSLVSVGRHLRSV